MNNLPHELIDRILFQCVHQCTRNEVLQCRLVCRAFDRFLKPYSCQTVGLVLSRLSRASPRRLPDQDALATIGKHCRAIYVDMVALRDEYNYGRTPLHLASEEGHVDVVRLLIDKGADVTIGDSYGRLVPTAPSSASFFD